MVCQQAEVHHTKAVFEPFSIPARCFDHAHIDLVEPLPSSQALRWPEVVPLTSTTCMDVARMFLSVWVACFGWALSLLRSCGQISGQVHCITAYHPEANGMCQRFHRSLKAGLQGAFLDVNWADQLPWAMFGLYSNPRKDLDTSPAELEKTPLH